MLYLHSIDILREGEWQCVLGRSCLGEWSAFEWDAMQAMDPRWFVNFARKLFRMWRPSGERIFNAYQFQLSMRWGYWTQTWWASNGNEFWKKWISKSSAPKTQKAPSSTKYQIVQIKSDQNTTWATSRANTCSREAQLALDIHLVTGRRVSSTKKNKKEQQQNDVYWMQPQP